MIEDGEGCSGSEGNMADNMVRVSDMEHVSCEGCGRRYPKWCVHVCAGPVSGDWFPVNKLEYLDRAAMRAAGWVRQEEVTQLCLQNQRLREELSAAHCTIEGQPCKVCQNCHNVITLLGCACSGPVNECLGWENGEPIMKPANLKERIIPAPGEGKAIVLEGISWKNTQYTEIEIVASGSIRLNYTAYSPGVLPFDPPMCGRPNGEMVIRISDGELDTPLYRIEELRGVPGENATIRKQTWRDRPAQF